MSASASRTDSTMIGHPAPAPQSLDHLDAVDAGQPEVEQDDVGMVPGREVERLLARRGEVDLVAAGSQVDAQGPPDLRLVVDHEDAGDGHRATHPASTSDHR